MLFQFVLLLLNITFNELLPKTDTNKRQNEPRRGICNVNWKTLRKLPPFQNFVALNGAFEAVESFTKSRYCTLTILIGMDLKNNAMSRDIGVFSLDSNELENKVSAMRHFSLSISASLIPFIPSLVLSLSLYFSPLLYTPNSHPQDFAVVQVSSAFRL